MHLTEGFSTVEKVLMAKSSQKHIPINGSIELLPLCNMNCDMCYVRLSREELEEKGRIRTVEEWMDIARQMKKAGTLFLLLTGGEPLIYPGFKELYVQLQQLGMILTINTNGTLIDEEWVAFFKQNKPRRVNITLYGASEKTYSELCHYPGGFEKAIKGIRLLRDNDIDVKIGGSLTKNNRDEIDQILTICEELSVPVQIDTYMMPAQRERELPFCMRSRVSPEEAAKVGMYAFYRESGAEKFQQFSEQMQCKIQEMKNGKEYPKGISCYAGNCSYAINWQGMMQPCVIMNGISISVFEYGFDEAWKYIVEETGKLVLNPKCITCHMRPLCRTCPACALYETGDYNGIPEYMCQFAEEAFRVMEQKDF